PHLCRTRPRRARVVRRGDGHMSETQPAGGKPGRPPAGARCAVHADATADFTCLRCGNFMCVACEDREGSGNCPACRERVGEAFVFPFTRENWSFGGLWEYCWSKFTTENRWLMLAAANLVANMIVVPISMVFNIAAVPLQNNGQPTPEALGVQGL